MAERPIGRLHGAEELMPPEVRILYEAVLEQHRVPAEAKMFTPEVAGVALLADGDLWISLDGGLVACHFQSRLDAPWRVTTEVTPWCDVVNPELSTDTVVLSGGAIALTVRLLVQIPRIEHTAVASSADDLLAFGLDVIARTR